MLALVAIALAACQPPVLRLTVDTAADLADAVPGDGRCEAERGGGCSLRAAISEANATAGFDRITIGPGIDPTLSLAGQGDDLNQSGDLDTAGDLEILGEGATVDGAGLDRVLHVVSGHLTVRDLTVTGGSVPTSQRGGGVWSRGALTVVGSVVTANTGAGIASDGTALHVSDSAVTDNATGSLPGALLVSSGTTTIVRSLLDDDSTGVYAFGTSVLTILDSTIHSGGDALDLAADSTATVLRSTLQTTGSEWGNFLIDAYPATAATVGGSVLDAPSADPSYDACFGGITSSGYNVVVDDSCELGGTGDVEGAAALLGPLTDNGGPTASSLPHAGSPAIDRIPLGAHLCGVVPLDQRAEPRPVGPACDAGAVEGVGPSVAPGAFTVDTIADGVDAAPGDGSCATADGRCSLRAAVIEANATNPHLPSLADTVFVPLGIDPLLSIAGADEDASLTGDLDVTGSLHVVGGTSSQGGRLTVDAGHQDRAFDSTAPLLTLANLTVANGVVTGDGGGLRSTRGAVTLTDTSVVSNRASGAGGGVSAIRVTGDRLEVGANSAGTDGGGVSTLFADLEETNLVENHATRAGGGANISQSGRVVRSSVVANTAASGGGLASSDGSSGAGGHLELVATTVTNNDAADISAVLAPGMFGPGLDLVASTIAENTGDDAILAVGRVCTRVCHEWDATVARGSIVLGVPAWRACASPLSTSSSFVLAPDGSCGATLPGTGALAPPQEHGPTWIQVPLPGSGAIDAVPVGTAGLCDGSVATDQRGTARPTGPACDVGAVEQ